MLTSDVGVFSMGSGRSTALRSQRAAFTIIELLITVIVIGILAAAGIAKYQSFAESGRRKTCLGQLKEIETALATWQTQNVAFAKNCKTAFAFTPRTGRLYSTDVPGSPYDTSAPPVLANAPLNAVGAPDDFHNQLDGSGQSIAGPLNSVIRDNNVWICPSGLTNFYGGDIQHVDESGTIVNPSPFLKPTASSSDTHNGGDLALRPDTTTSLGSGNVVGLFGRYGVVAVGDGTDTAGSTYTNAYLPSNWVTGKTDGTSADTPAPQVPFQIAVCGCYGTFGPSYGPNYDQPGTDAITSNGGGGGGPVGGNGSELNRHSSRW